MGVEGAPQRRKVKQLQAHGQHDPRDGQAWVRGPGPAFPRVLAVRKRAPQDVLGQAHADVGGHVVAIVPAHELEVRDVAAVGDQARGGPEADGAGRAAGYRRRRRSGAGGRLASVGGAGPVEAKDANDGQVQAVQHAGAGCKVVELLGGPGVAGVEDDAEQPRGDPSKGEADVVLAQRVRLGYVAAEPPEAEQVGVEVSSREDDREGLLHAQDAVKGPLAVELDYGLARLDAIAGDYVLTRVVALGRAGPQ